MSVIKTTKTSQSPRLFVLVGNARVPVQMQSQLFRRLIRSAVSLCVEKSREQKKTVSARNLLLLTRRYQHALLYTLTTSKVDGICWTATAIPQENFDYSDKEGAALWEQLRTSCKANARNLAPNRCARLRRINLASTTCDVSILREAIDNVELTFALQVKIGISTRSQTSVKSIPQHTKHLVRAPIPWSDFDPPLRVGRNGSFFGFSDLHPSVISNSLTVGGTGSGKSQSVILPILNALLNYQLNDGTVASVMVVDPKRELEAKVRAVLNLRGEQARLVVIGECPAVPLFAEDSPLTMSDRLAKLQTFGPTDSPDGDHSYWKNLGMAVVLDLMQLEDAFFQLTQGMRLTALLCSELQLPKTENVGYWSQLRALLAYTRTSRARLKETDSLLRFVCLQAKVACLSTQVMQVYGSDDELMRQWCYAVQSAEPLINALANPDMARFVDLDPISCSLGQHTDIANLVEQGKVILFCPEPTEGHRIAAKAVKSKFFEAVFARHNLRRPIGIVIDEAQKFITNDAESGEQSFLDRCRAYRCIVAMATQSISSLKHALGSNSAAQTAVEIVTANTPTKFVMRTTDVETVTWLKAQLPMSNDSDPHVVDVRRPSALKPGEAYFLLADGSWGRKRARLDHST